MNDWVRLDDPHDSRYEYPNRTLSCSDLIVARLRVDKNSQSQPNSHIGLEMAILLKGSVTIAYTGSYKTIGVLEAGKGFAHFSSEKEHKVWNHTNELAEVLVIRFYGEGQHSQGEQQKGPKKKKPKQV